MANLHVKLPDELYANLQSSADRNFRSVSAQIVFLIETWLKEEQRSLETDTLLQQIRQQALSGNKSNLSRQKLLRNRAKRGATTGLRGLESVIGAISLGHPTDTDNDSIDADLARAYAGDTE